MIDIRYDVSLLSDPKVFALGQAEPVSDHACFRSEEEANKGCSSMVECLDGMWKFSYAPSVPERAKDFYRCDYDVSAWKEIKVPSHIQLMGYDAPQYVNTQYPWDGVEQVTAPNIPERFNPVASYAREFTVPDDWRDNRVILQFEGVESAMFAWVNGKLIGYGEDGFTPARFDITEALRQGKNKLAVEVFKFCSGSWLNDQDFWRFSGIFRSVYLKAEPKAHINDIFALAQPDLVSGKGTLDLRVKLTLPNEPVTIGMALLDGKGQSVDQVSLKAQAFVSMIRTLEHPLLWSAEMPNLYTLCLTLTDESGHVIETARTEIGFREFKIEQGVMLLNGKRIIFNGVDRHEFSAEHGRAITEEEILQDVITLKKNNINAVRTSHYPNQSLFYRLCDRFGIYVIDETNMETHGTWSIPTDERIKEAIPGDKPEWLDAVLRRAQNMQERDKNHASVLIWSCGNESFGGLDILKMSRQLKERDPHRPVHYEGVHNDRRYNETSDIESQMYTTAQKVREYLTAHHDKPFILCEYTHAMGNSCGGMSKYIELIDEFPQYQGAFVWDFIDQTLPKKLPSGKTRVAYGGDFEDRPNDATFCGNGLMFSDRRPSPKLQEVKYLYQPVRIIPDKTGVTLDNRSLFDDLSGLTLSWSLLQDGETVAEGELAQLAVPPGEKRRLALPLPKLEGHGEYVLTVKLLLKSDTLYAQSGYQLMLGQAILKSPEPLAIKGDGGAEVIRGHHNISVCGQDFRALFSFEQGGLTAYGRPGEGLIVNHAPTLSLWRAPTDNDRGNGFARKTALWEAFSQNAAAEWSGEAEKDGCPTAMYRYRLPEMTDAVMTVQYTVRKNGAILVTLDFAGEKGLPEFPAFGLSLRLPVSLCKVRYYGRGPLECSNDRMQGALLGNYQTTVQDNLTPYHRPQFCGNRTGVRRLDLTDSTGRGLRVSSVDEPLEISFLHYSQAQLKEALHQDELPDAHYTYLDIASARAGIAGDNSWGAPILPEYRLSAEQPRRLNFLIELI